MTSAARRWPTKAKTAARGYGSEHQRERARWKARMATGEVVECWRCDRPIDPAEPWDLGHDDHDRRIYRGPEHPACNRATAFMKAARRRVSQLQW